jgi:hypothetical protein
VSSIQNKLKAMRDLLDGAIESAPAYIAGDQVHSWEILKNRPGTCKIAIGFEGEKARVNFAGGDITSRVNQTYYAIISRGRGLNQTRSDDLIYGTGGGSGLFLLAEQMRDMLRSMTFNPMTDEQPDYVGLEEWGKEIGFVIDAYICRIWVGTQLIYVGPKNPPAYSSQSPNPITPPIPPGFLQDPISQNILDPNGNLIIPP